MKTLHSVIFLILITRVMAVSVSQSALGHSGFVDVVFQPSTGEVHWNWSTTRGSGEGGPGVWLTTTSGNGGAYGSPTYFDVSPSASTAGNAGVIPGLTQGSWLMLAVRISGPEGSFPSNAGHTHFNDVKAYFQVGAGSYKVTVKLFNSRTVPARYKLMQGSANLGEVTLQPNTGLIQTFTTSSNDPVTVLEEIDDLTKDGPLWVEVTGAVTSVPVATITPIPTSQPDDPQTVNQSPDIPNSPKTETSTSPVWKQPTPNNDPTQQKDLLTNAVFREGIEKLLTPPKVGPFTSSIINNTPPASLTTYTTALTSLKNSIPNIPNPISVAPSGNGKLTVVFPGFTYAALTFPGKTIVIDPTEYDEITYMRELLNGLLHFAYFLSVFRLFKSAFFTPPPVTPPFNPVN